uniref:Uncharacterized protein n=1 Tax=Triatoma infestans TaxID=30076 RepID=A0A161M4C7_TRIIF
MEDKLVIQDSLQIIQHYQDIVR